MDLTPEEIKLLNFIEEYRNTKGSQPTQRDIAKYMNYSSPGALHYMLEVLEKKGAIKLTRQSRNIEINPQIYESVFTRLSAPDTQSFSLLQFPKPPRKLYISNTANDLINSYSKDVGIPSEHLFPLNIENVVVKCLSHSVGKITLPRNISGRRKDREILVNVNESPQRQRFSIGHEAGHILLHWDISEIEEMHEKEADYFSASLLMPAHHLFNLIEELMEKDANENTLIVAVMQHFDVSRQASIVRLQDLMII